MLKYFKNIFEKFLKIAREYFTLASYRKKVKPEDTGEIKRKIALTNLVRLITLSAVMALIYLVILIVEIVTTLSAEGIWLRLSVAMTEVVIASAIAIFIFVSNVSYRKIWKTSALIYTYRICYTVIITELLLKIGFSFLCEGNVYQLFILALILAVIPVMSIGEQCFSYIFSFAGSAVFCMLSEHMGAEELFAIAGVLAVSCIIASCNRVHIYNVIYTDIEMFRLNNELASAAVCDPLTKLPNRRALENFLNTIFPFWLEKNANISFAVCDIDNFKCYNDTYSHVAGDDALQKVSAAMKQSIQTGEKETFLSRIGGEEFVVIFAGWNGVNEVDAFYEDLRTAVRGLGMPSGQGAVHEVVTISIGIHTFKADEVTGISIDKAYAMADKKLYEAKSSGRDKICRGGMQGVF